MSSADAYSFASSTQNEKRDPVYCSKQWAYQIDQNNSNYASKQIIFDLSGFYNSQRFINCSEMQLVIPVVTTLSSVGAGASSGLGCAPHISVRSDGTINNVIAADNGAAVTNRFAMGFKSGYWHLINSLQVQVDGKDVIQLTPNIGYHASFVANTTWSDTDIQKHGPLTGYLPDTADSWNIYSNNATEQGWGVCNNSLPPKNRFKPYPGDSVALATQPGASSAFAYTFDQTYADPDSAVNDAFYQRMKWTNNYNKNRHVSNLPVSDRTVTARGVSKIGCSVQSTVDDLENVMLSETIPALGAKDTVETVDPYVKTGIVDSNAANAYRTLHTTCVIRLKDVCDLFSKLPLSRGLYMRIILNMNTGYVKCSLSNQGLTTPVAWTSAATSLQPTYSSADYTNTFPGTCPVMLAPLVVSHLTPKIAIGAGVAFTPTQSAGNFPADSTLSVYPGVACDVGTTARTGLLLSVAVANPDPIHPSALAVPSHALKNCRIYAPIIDMDPDLTQKYLSDFKIKGIFYRDVLQFVMPNQQPGYINYQLANGITNAKRLIIIPFFNATPQSAALPSGGQQSLTGGALMQFEPTSPFDSAPSTVAPQNALLKFNVLLSNMNMFQRHVDYSFENFISEMSPANAINGGLHTGLTCGQIDYHKWCNNYRYYVVDLSRRLAGDNTPKSITIQGYNGSIFNVDYYCFVEYERHLEMNVDTGHIAASSN